MTTENGPPLKKKAMFKLATETPNEAADGAADGSRRIHGSSSLLFDMHLLAFL